MKKISMMALVATFCVAGSLWACDKDGKIAKVAGKTPPCCQKQLDGAVTKVVSSMPKMTYRVGSFETCCSKTAAAKAGADGKLQYVVAAKGYDNEGEASIALAELLEKEIETLKTVQFAAGGKTYGCPMSAKAAAKAGQQVQYRLAGFDFATQEDADQALKIINCKLSGCDKDCSKECMKNCTKGARAAAKSGCHKGKTALTASAKDLPCHKGLAGTKTVADGQKPCCPKGNAAKATTVAGKDSPCSKGAKAATVVSKRSPCGKTAAAVAGQASPRNKAAKAVTVAAGQKPCCAKGKAAKATTVAGKDSPCSKSAKATTVAGADKPCCPKGKAAKAATVAAKSSPCNKAAKATTVAGAEKPCCPKGKATKATTVAGKTSPCNKSAKAATVAAKSSPCNKAAKAVTVAAQGNGGCCKKAQQRLATAQDQIQTIVKAAASLALAS